jgi:catecholate siderophore receptor
LYNQTDLIIRFNTGEVAHTVTAGYEIGREYYEAQVYDWLNETTQDLENPVYGPLGPTGIRAATTFTDNESESHAFYVNDQISFGEQWKLVLGIRKDDFDFSTKVTGSLDPLGNVDLDTSDEMTSHRAGVIYQPDDRQSYYISYGTSFNPSAETLTLSEANRETDPEETQSKEIGAKWDLLNGGLSLTAAIFDVEKKNARSIDPLTLFAQLDGETAVDGYEVGISGRLGSGWQVFAGYTHLDGEIIRLTESSNDIPVVRDGNILANTPEDSASFWATYESGAWEFGGGAVYSSERMVNNANTSIVDGYTRYDATAAYEMGNHELRLNLQNLSDEEYFEVASGSRATPATGMIAILTLTSEF